MATPVSTPRKSALCAQIPIPVSIICKDVFTEAELFEALTPFECTQYAHVPDYKKCNWLLGRMAGKSAVLKYFRKDQTTPRSLHDVEIVSGGNTPPIFKIITDTKNYAENYSLSISHSHGVAVAEVIDGSLGKKVGVDVERIRDFHEETLRGFLTDEEYGRCSEAGLEYSFNTEATLHWCLKEAYLKATGMGLRIHPRTVEIVPYKPRHGHTTFIVAGDPVPVQSYWTTFENLYIIASIIL